MKAVIYARYSSHAQREESIEGQLRECHEYAEKNGLTVIAEYCDHALSGKTDNRPQFQKMIYDAEHHKFDAVIMYTLDRFARNRYDSAIYKTRLKKAGVQIHYAKQPMPETPEGIILESILEGYAEYYSENLSRNIKRGKKENALKGLSTNGSTPLGYYMKPDKTLGIDPVGAKTVREIFELYADGISSKKIIAYCNKQGYKTSRGKPFQRTSLGTILRNEKYTGKFSSMGVVIEDHIPPIIPKELFNKVQSMLRHNATAPAKAKAKEDYLLTTKVFCGHCGERMVGESGTSRNGTIYRYYKCIGRKHGSKCDKKPERKEWLENFVVDHIKATVLTDANIESIADRVIELVEKEFSDTSLISSIKTQISETTSKINNLLSAVEQGIQSDSLQERLTTLEKTKHDLELQLAKETMKKPPLTRDQIIYWLTSFKDGSTEDDEYKRKLIDTLLNSVYVYDLPTGSRKFVFTFNTTGGYTSEIHVSDIEQSSRFKCEYPNIYCPSEFAFGYSIVVEDVS